MIESHKTSENFSSWVHKVLEKLKSYDLRISYDPNSNTLAEHDDEDDFKHQLEELELGSEISNLSDEITEFMFSRKVIQPQEGNSGG